MALAVSASHARAWEQAVSFQRPTQPKKNTASLNQTGVLGIQVVQRRWCLRRQTPTPGAKEISQHAMRWWTPTDGQFGYIDGASRSILGAKANGGHSDRRRYHPDGSSWYSGRAHRARNSDVGHQVRHTPEFAH